MQGIMGSSLLKSCPLALSPFIKAGSPCSSFLLAGQATSSPLDSFGSIHHLSLTLGGVRWKHSKKVNTKVQRLVPGGIKHLGFTYFPRFPDQEEPPCQPAKLFMVKRIRSTIGCPYWEKEWIESFKLGDRGAVAIVKNTPSNNARLYKLKHLVQITPITTPYGMPEDPKYGFLKENGEFISYSCIAGNQLQLGEAEEKSEEVMQKSVDGETLKYRLRKKWYSRW